MNVRPKLSGGTSITVDTAIELRKVVFGSAAAPPRGEWTRTAIVFPSVKDELPYGLRSPRNATRGLQSVLQAFIIKHFIFDMRPRDRKSVPLEVMLKPNENQQNEALLAAMSEILWNIGEKSKATVVLPGEVPLIAHSHTYFQDSVTEKSFEASLADVMKMEVVDRHPKHTYESIHSPFLQLFIFELAKLEDLQIFLKRYMYFFTDDPGAGALLFLYSAVMTRTPSKVLTDLDAPKGAHLMGPHEEGSLNIVMLLLSGRATPYLHNGVIYVGDEDHYALPQFGILARAVVGLLILEGDAQAVTMSSRQPGSRLKTPALPIWVTSCCGHYGVLFNSNRELLRNYHAEKRFELHYYTCASCYLVMSVDNRSQDEPSNGGGGNNASSSNSANLLRDDVVASPLERLIHTKWAEAKVTIKGPIPASMAN